MWMQEIAPKGGTRGAEQPSSGGAQGTLRDLDGGPIGQVRACEDCEKRRGDVCVALFTMRSGLLARASGPEHRSDFLTAPRMLY